MFKRLVVPFAYVLLLGACVSKPAFIIDSDAQQLSAKSGTGIAVIDNRPVGDRESSMGSMLISSDRYGIYVLGDERFVPAPAAALSHRAERIMPNLSPRPGSVTITLNRFNTQNNAQAAMRNGAIGASGLGPLGVVLAEGLLGKLREQNVDARKPFVLTYAEMNAEFVWPDNTHTVRTITAMKANNYSESDLEEQKAVIGKTVSSVLDTLAADLKTAATK